MNIRSTYTMFIFWTIVFGVSAMENQKESLDCLTFTVSSAKSEKNEPLALKILEELVVGRELIIQQLTGAKKYSLDYIDWAVMRKNSEPNQREDFDLDKSSRDIKNQLLSIIQQNGSYYIKFILEDKPYIFISGCNNSDMKSYCATYFLK